LAAFSIGVRNGLQCEAADSQTSDFKKEAEVCLASWTRADLQPVGEGAKAVWVLQVPPAAANSQTGIGNAYRWRGCAFIRITWLFQDMEEVEMWHFAQRKFLHHEAAVAG